MKILIKKNNEKNKLLIAKISSRFYHNVKEENIEDAIELIGIDNEEFIID